MSVLTRLANAVVTAGAVASRVRFARALRDPAAAQRALLARLLRANAESAYGRAHGFARIRDGAGFAERVPLVTYDEVAPWVDRVASGEAGVLTAEPVRCLEPTGGSSGYLKLVPCTDALRREFSAATLPWIHDLLTQRPALAGGSAYWAITPPGRRPARTAGGVPIGLDDDADYFPAPLRPLLRRTLAVPPVIAQTHEIDACRHLTLLALLAADDLALVSVWSPSFLALLAARLDERWDELLHDLEHGTFSVFVDQRLVRALRRPMRARPRRARALRAAFGTRPPEDLGALWPRLALISCWTEGHAALALAGVRARFPRVEVQGKGLLATEGVVSIPLFGAEAPVMAAASHYLELLDPRDGTAIPMHEAEVGGTYEVAMSTGGGLYRYRLRDLVRVEGRLHRTPLVSFQGRADHASDLAGEKLTPALAERAIADAMRTTGIRAPFAMLAPVTEPAPSYRLYVDATPEDAERLAAAVDDQLRRAHHYALCRMLGQLGPVTGVAVPDAHRAYERACAARGQRAGAVKPPALECDPRWSRLFAHDQEPARA